MTDLIETFFDTWGMADNAARTDAIRAVYAKAGTYADPRSPDVLTGPEAIAAYVSMFSENAPDWTAKLVKSDEVAGLTRATVAFGGQGPDGSDMVQHGQYFVETDGDTINRMVGFAGLGAPE